MEEKMKKFLVVSIVFGILFVVLGLNLSAQSSDDKNACEYARKESNIDTWKFYLDSFPNGECADEAKAALEGADNAKDQIACNRARQIASFDGWKQYLETFTNGKCNFEAKMFLKKSGKLKSSMLGIKKNSDYVYLDLSTNLMWSEKSDKIKWDYAHSHCSNLKAGGYCSHQSAILAVSRVCSAVGEAR